jgi:hypothetical protein
VLRDERLLWEASFASLRGQDAVGVPLFNWWGKGMRSS